MYAREKEKTTDKDTPEVDEHEQAKVEPPVQGEQEDKQVVGHALEVAVHGVECMGRERRRD
jgi:hypothetical protein